MHPSEHSFPQEQTPVSAIPLLAWWLLPNSGQVYTNTAFQAFTGAAAHLESDQLFNWIHPSDTAALREILQKLPAETTRCYYRLKSKEGKYRWHCHSWSPYPSAAEVQGYMNILQDIHELYSREAFYKSRFEEVFNETSQLANTNQELSHINFRLRNILDSTSDAMCSRDMNLRILAFNKAFEKEYLTVFGTAPRIGQSIEETLKHLPAELERVKVLWQRALNGEAFTILQEFGDPQFARNYYEVNFNPIYDDRGRQIGATIAAKDITGARKIEKELKDAREFLILAENIPHIIFTTDSNGRPDYVNQAFYEYTGLQNVDLSSPFGPILIHPDDFPYISTRWVESVKNTEGLQQEVRIKHNTGEYRWNLMRFIPLVAAEGNVYKWIGSATDIHEAKVAEEKQRLAAQEFRQLAESLPLIIWTTNARGELNYMNNKWYEYTGLPQEQVSSDYWEEHIHPDDLDQTLQSWAHSVAEKEEYLVEYRLRNKDGEYRWFLGMGTPLINSEGEPVKWFGSSTDIHDQKQHNRRLWQQNLQLNQINQYLDNFVHTAAHDLRAPIANIKGLLSLFDFASADKKEQIVDNLRTSANRLDNTLQGMIQLIEAQNQSSDISRNINVGEVFSETIDDFENELAGLDYEINSDFTACPELAFVLPYLRSIFRNLLSNSIKYRKPDEKLQIHANCKPEGDFIAITYQDNGIGIDIEKNGKNLFRPFKRFTKQASGKGIGMHIVKNMLVKTGGKISVSSEPGQGVTFKLHLRNLHDTQQEELNQALGPF
jgi:PAS domain S-box-containing protein